MKAFRSVSMFRTPAVLFAAVLTAAAVTAVRVPDRGGAGTAVGNSTALSSTVTRLVGSSMLAPTPDGRGYWEVTVSGGVYSFGDAQDYGSLSQTSAAGTRDIGGIEPTPDGGGYWLVGADGGVFSFGDAPFYGSLPGLPASEQPGAPVIGMASTADGRGYWEATSKGDVYSFGDAQFHGSTGAIVLDKPIVQIVPTPDGGGYWLVASDGGVFSFGDAPFYGSLPGLPADVQTGSPVIGLAPTPDGRGYWEVTMSGGVYSFGDAQFHGAVTDLPADTFIEGIQSTPDGGGYWLISTDAGVYTFGDAQNYGSSPSPGYSQSPQPTQPSQSGTPSTGGSQGTGSGSLPPGSTPAPTVSYTLTCSGSVSGTATILMNDPGGAYGYSVTYSGDPSWMYTESGVAGGVLTQPYDSGYGTLIGNLKMGYDTTVASATLSLSPSDMDCSLSSPVFGMG